MEKSINLFLEFDNTQFSGNLHDILTNYLNKYEDNKIPGLTKRQLQSELTGEARVTERSIKAIQEAIKSYTRNPELNERDHTGDFFDGKRLNEFVGNLQQKGINVRVLTTSPLTSVAIRALYDMHNFDHFKKVQIFSVQGTLSPERINRVKNELISHFEQEAFSKGADKVVNFLVDSNQSNINAFKKNRNTNSNIGIHTPNGLNSKLLVDLEKRVLSENKNIRKPKKEFFSSGLASYFFKKTGLNKNLLGSSNEPWVEGKRDTNIDREGIMHTTYAFPGRTNKETLKELGLILNNDKSSKIEKVYFKSESGLRDTLDFYQGTNKENFDKINAILNKHKNIEIESTIIGSKVTLKASENTNIKRETNIDTNIDREGIMHTTYAFPEHTNKETLEKLGLILKNDKSSKIETVYFQRESGIRDTHYFYQGTNKEHFNKINDILNKHKNTEIQSIIISSKETLKASENNNIKKDDSNQYYTLTFSGSTNNDILKRLNEHLEKDQSSKIESFKISDKDFVEVINRRPSETNKDMVEKLTLLAKENKINNVTIEGKSVGNHIQNDIRQGYLENNGLKLEKIDKNKLPVSSQEKVNESGTHVSSKKDFSAMTQPLNKDMQKTLQPSAVTTKPSLAEKAQKVVRFKK